MTHDNEARIRQRAYEIWLDAGTPEGMADRHWHQAEQEIDAADPEDAATQPWQDPDATGSIGGEIEPGTSGMDESDVVPVRRARKAGQRL